MSKGILKDGQYYYAPHRSQWGIWQWHSISDANAPGMVAGGSGTFVKDCPTKEEAREEVYRLNGWASTKPKPTQKHTQ